ncbi:MAG: DNA repair protein RadA [Bacteroidetes bacterium]|nr:DNA repair protein RadA [Bacteroidota bacterium]
MSKIKSAFFCQNCGQEAAKWLGKCPSCKEWNTFVEERIEKNVPQVVAFSTTHAKSKPQNIQVINRADTPRIELKDQELNRVLGGGMVPGSLILFGGEPGIGKSTLMLQLAIKDVAMKVLYVSGEESEQQVKMRAERIGITNEQCFILTETHLQAIFEQAEEVKPNLLIIDSIQTLYSSDIESSPGSVSQIKECTAQLLRYSKTTDVPVFLIGHITKEGSLAGPKVLEHMVDCVLQFEGDRNHVYRLLRTVKNRFGSTNELGIYEMVGSGLREVLDPSDILITHQENSLSGVSVAATMEGMRPLLVEIQALVSTAAYGTPQRSSTGFDAKRLNMLLAVMEKRCGFKLASKDVFLNVTGGLKIDDPAIDLAVVAAVLSSNANLPLGRKVALAGEVGLSGEIRPVSRIEQRISEAEKLGFDQIVISKYCKGISQKNHSISIEFCGKMEEAVKILFG